MAKKSFTKEIEALLDINKPVEEERPKGKVGRPRKNRRTTSSQAGLPEGETRMTFIVKETQQDKMKYISYREGLSIKEILNEAITDYLNKYESLYGEIDLNR